jgi:hypothetical protein
VPDLSSPFTEMAARIQLNAEEGFGGAFVIVPPGEEAKTRSLLMLDNAESPAMFWAALQTTCEIALQEIRAAEEQNAGFGGLRR